MSSRRTNGAGTELAVGFLVAHEVEGRPVADAVLRGQLAARWSCAQQASSGDLVAGARLDELVREAAGALQVV